MKKSVAFLCQRAGFIVGIVATVAFTAPSPLDYKTFVNGGALWISEPAGIMLYRNDTKSVRNIVLCDTVENDSVIDIVENSAALWVLSKSGVYQIDFGTTTVERLPGGKKGASGAKLTVDDDYVWAALGDTLWRFDKLSREWFPYPMNLGANALLGLYSNATNIYCVLPSSVKIFSTKDEKWLEFPNKKGITIGSQSRFFLDRDVLLLVDGQSMFRYLVKSQSWDLVSAPSPVLDMLTQDSVLYYFTASGIFKYNTITSVKQPEDVPELSRVRNFSLYKDTLYCATDAQFIKYDMHAKAADNIQAPQNIPDYTVLKTIILGSSLIIVCPKSIGVFNEKVQFWENVPIAALGNKRKRITWDDDNGLKVNYTNGYSSQLTGSIQKNYTIDSLVNKKDSSFLYFQNQAPIANLTLHNSFPKGRYLDAFFDNSNISQVPKKGVFYRGAATDRVESARLGTGTVDLPQSKTIVASQFEGVNAVFQSKTSLATRDRKIVKAQVGSGLFISKTVYKVLSYSDKGLYNIKGAAASDEYSEADSADTQAVKSTSEIVPGSRKIFIDGEEIDTNKYNLVNSTGDLVFKTDVPMDPTSVISVSYQVRTVPDSGVRYVEMLPKNHFGNLGYASVTVSPTDWISPQAGYFYLKTDSVHQLMNISSPAEIRSSKAGGIFLKVNPELTWDAATNKKAGALSLQSRFGEKLSVFMNGLMPDSGFKTTDNLDRGYGSLKHDLDYKIAYDIKKEVPVSYYQHDIASDHGTERYYEIGVGSHFQGLPFCDLTLSRNQVDGVRIDSGVSADTASDLADTLNRLKNKFRLRLYETSSPYVESFLHISQLKYDLSYTGFSSNMERQSETGYGSIFFGNVALSPIKRLTLSLNTTFLNNPDGSLYKTAYHPTITLQTIDAPPGVELSFRNEVDFKSRADSAKSLSSVQRTAGLTLKPGTWTKYLSWVSPIATFNQSVSCVYHETDPGIGNVFLANQGITRQTYTSGLGASIFPTNDIIFYDKNEWTTADSSTKFFSVNDLKWWFGQRRMWQTRWQYTKDRPRFEKGITRDNHDITMQYTINWNSWLQTIGSGLATITSDDTTQTSKIGPKASVTFNKQKFSFIRDIMNNHTLQVQWVTKNGKTESSPEIAYNLFLKLVVYPNISFYMNDIIGLKQGKFSNLSATIYGTLIF